MYISSACNKIRAVDCLWLAGVDCRRAMLFGAVQDSPTIYVYHSTSKNPAVSGSTRQYPPAVHAIPGLDHGKADHGAVGSVEPQQPGEALSQRWCRGCCGRAALARGPASICVHARNARGQYISCGAHVLAWAVAYGTALATTAERYLR